MAMGALATHKVRATTKHQENKMDKEPNSATLNAGDGKVGAGNRGVLSSRALAVTEVREDGNGHGDQQHQSQPNHGALLHGHGLRGRLVAGWLERADPCHGQSDGLEVPS